MPFRLQSPIIDYGGRKGSWPHDRNLPYCIAHSHSVTHSWAEFDGRLICIARAGKDRSRTAKAAAKLTLLVKTRYFIVGMGRFEGNFMMIRIGTPEKC